MSRLSSSPLLHVALQRRVHIGATCCARHLSCTSAHTWCCKAADFDNRTPVLRRPAAHDRVLPRARASASAGGGPAAVRHHLRAAFEHLPHPDFAFLASMRVPLAAAAPAVRAMHASTAPVGSPAACPDASTHLVHHLVHHLLFAQVCCGDSGVDGRIAEKIHAFSTWAAKHPGRRNQVLLLLPHADEGLAMSQTV